jgi:3-oxoacyl-[acyl-carrier-protein] synthase III
MTPKVSIWGVGHYVPEKILKNSDLEKMVDTTDEWIRTRTGICERHLAAENEATSDMAVNAALNAIKMSGVKSEDIDAVICATLTPDYPWPATACIIQEKVQATRAFSFDISAACSGFVYALSLAESMIASGQARYVLVCGADKLSSIVNWKDRNTAVLFGDGASAAILGPLKERGKILAFDLGTKPAVDLLLQPAGGSRRPASFKTVEENLHTLTMNGKEVFKFAVRIMGEAAEKALQKAGLNHSDIALFIPHQANIRIIEAAAKRLELPMEKVFINVDKYGNTSAASVGIALVEAVQQGRLKPGDKTVLVAFGAGLTWGALVLEW